MFFNLFSFLFQISAFNDQMIREIYRERYNDEKTESNHFFIKRYKAVWNFASTIVSVKILFSK